MICKYVSYTKQKKIKMQVIIDQPSGKFDLCLLGYAARALKKREQKPEGDRHALFL